MEGLKSICKKLIFPHWPVILVLAVFSGAGLAWVFSTHRETSWMAYPIYVLSFYALTVLCVWLVPVCIRLAKAKKDAPPPTAAELEQRFRKSLISGLALNLTYALFHMFMGAASRSPWVGSQGAYQLIIALIHLVLLHYDRRLGRETDPRRKAHTGWAGFQSCGIWLLILHLTMTGLVFQMVWNGETENYPGVMIFAVAAYTFYKLTMAIIRVVSLILGVLSTLVMGLGMSMCLVWAGPLLLPGIVLGVAGILGVALAYPMYCRITQAERQRIAPEILRLTEELGWGESR